MNRNVNDYFAKTPTPHFPRSRFDMGIHKRLQTQQHGRLCPFFCRIVYPGDTWQMDMSVFVRMDTSLRVPLDDVYLDTYFFFVPFRIIDDNFAKVLGEVEPYDDDQYDFPTFMINGGRDYFHDINCLLPYLGYSQAEADANAYNQFAYAYDHHINPYPLAAYYKIYNDWFRDENLDPSIPYTDMYGSNESTLNSTAGALFENLNCKIVNKYHDFWTSAMISPQKGPAQTIPLGTTAPVGIIPDASGTTTSQLNVYSLLSGEAIVDGKFAGMKTASSNAGVSGLSQNLPIVTDLSNAAGTINQLRLAFAIQALYERRGHYGTRYIETIRGQWGIEVPDSFFQRPEYLGGARTMLNNIPVLSTENSSQLGQMSGNSSTLAGGNSWTKTFIEYGVIIGVSCTRVKHSYGQGYDEEIFGLKSSLDLYNPVFANIGFTGIKRNSIYNTGDADEGVVFAYQEAWSRLRTQTDSFAGLFGMISGNSDLKNKWHYGDYYSSAPSFSATWMKEDFKNVARTLTGQLIAGAPNLGTGETDFPGHQFMFGYFFHPIVTRILPSHSVPVELVGRL